MTNASSPTSPSVTVIRHWADDRDLAQVAAVVAAEGLDVRRAALHVQLVAERHFGELVTLHNATIADALVEFYGCRRAEVPADAYERAWRGPGVVDLYWHRDFRWDGDESILEDPALQRDGLPAYVDRAGTYSD